EEAFENVLDVVETGGARSRRLEGLASLPFVYLPGRGTHDVERAIYAEFGIESQPTNVVVPYSSAIFSRASVEVMRGCTRGCRFCHAGTWYRPVRERPADQVIEAGFAAGYTSLKLYFMIGLPRETHDEVQGIVDLAVRAREIGRTVNGRGAPFSVHVSVSNFVPKPHTPFQWEGMSSREQLVA